MEFDWESWRDEKITSAKKKMYRIGTPCTAIGSATLIGKILLDILQITQSNMAARKIVDNMKQERARENMDNGKGAKESASLIINNKRKPKVLLVLVMTVSTCVSIVPSVKKVIDLECCCLINVIVLVTLHVFAPLTW